MYSDKGSIGRGHKQWHEVDNSQQLTATAQRVFHTVGIEQHAYVFLHSQ